MIGEFLSKITSETGYIFLVEEQSNFKIVCVIL